VRGCYAADAASYFVVENAKWALNFPQPARGARATRDLSAMGDPDIVFLSLPNEKVVREVVAGERDKGAMIAVFEDLLGVQYRSR